MTRMKLSRWFAVLTLVIALASSIASVLEADTLSISGPFHMDQLRGTVGADLAEVFAHDNEDTWSLTLFGITQSNEYIEYYENGADGEAFVTRVHATSFEFGFVGPDADVLNDVISQQLTTSSLGDDLFLELWNVYSYGGFWPGSGFWEIGLLPLDDTVGVSFFAQGEGSIAVPNYTGDFWFPAEYDFIYPYGFPLVVPQTIRSQTTSIHDSRPGSSGTLVSTGGFVDLGVTVFVLDGDFNGDSSVDGDDFLKWQRGESPNPLSGSDLAAWQANYGASGSLASAVAVPEPANLVLLALGLPLLVWRNSRRYSTDAGSALGTMTFYFDANHSGM
jgi:hypothetical protein